MPQMAELDQLAHFQIRDGPVLAALSRDKPMNASFHTAHIYQFHRAAQACAGWMGISKNVNLKRVD